MNELQVINDERFQIFSKENLGSVRTIFANNQVWFCIKDVCDILELTNPTVVAKRLDEDEKAKFDLGLKNGELTNFTNESGLYTLILRSDKKEAKPFRKWITSEVIPAIRKTGMYMTDNVWDTITNNPEKLGEVLINYGKVKRELEQLEEENQIQKQLIAEYKPIKEYVDTILSSEDTMTTTQIAADYGFSAYELNKTLNEQRVVRKVGGQWILYIEYMNKGYTKSETMTVKKKDGTDKVVANTKWTQKGRLFIHNLLENLGIKANMDREKEGA